MSFGGRDYVKFYSATETADDAGSETVSYVLEFSAMVSFRTEKIRKTEDGEIRQSAEVSALIRLPFTESIKYDWRVEYRSVSYDIEAIRDPSGLRRDLELTVVAVER